MQRGTRIVVRLIRVAVVTDESSELVQITVRTSSAHPTCGIPAIDAATMRSQQSSDLIVLVLDQHRTWGCVPRESKALMSAPASICRSRAKY